MRYWPVSSVTAAADFLDERRAGGFDGHAWQHTAGRVANGSREGCLGKYSCRKQKNNEERQTLQRSSHTARLSLQVMDKSGIAAALPRPDSGTYLFKGTCIQDAQKIMRRGAKMSRNSS